ncbi:hypothetical protein UJUPTIQU_CDS0002 [Pectobacterium phage Abuela]|uniref:Uncharacterized protein n=1 Tax=Pectobacterium phage Sabo TaxID=3158141 RepID=A0AB39ABV3_9CAUD
MGKWFPHAETRVVTGLSAFVGKVGNIIIIKRDREKVRM